MGNINTHRPSAQSIHEYQLALEKYEKDCAAMEAEEAASRARSVPDSPTLATYFCLQGTALCCELPCRTMWHGSCLVSHGCCCLPFSLCFDYMDSAICLFRIGMTNLAGSALEWHLKQTKDYIQLCRFLAINMYNPCDPHWIYAPDVSITRPIRPTMPHGSGNAQGNGGDLCDSICNCCYTCDMICNTNDCCDSSSLMQQMESLHNRDIRSKLCILSLWNWFDCFESFHLSTCFGPWPCLGETPEERMLRWNIDYSVKKDKRTSEFWKLRDCHSDRYSFCRSESNQRWSASIVESVDEGMSYDDMLPWARVLVGSMIGLTCVASCIGANSLLLSLTSGATGSVTTGNISSLMICLTQPNTQLQLACCGGTIGGVSGYYGGECRGPSCFPCCLRGGGATHVHSVEYNPFSVFDAQESMTIDEVELNKLNSNDNRSSLTNSFGQSPESMVIFRPQSVQIDPNPNESKIQNYGTLSSPIVEADSC